MCSHDSVVIDVSTDGVNAFGFRCKAKFWPILGCLAGDSEPFIIGCFFGKSKPGDLQTFLADFSAEVAVLSEDGVFFFCMANALISLYEIISWTPKQGHLSSVLSNIMVKRGVKNAALVASIF